MLIGSSLSFGQNGVDTPFAAGGAGLETSIWKPSSLDDYPARAFKPVTGSQASFGIFFFTPHLNNFALRISLMQWHQGELSDRSHLDSVTLRHLSLELKQSIVAGTRISPFVSYGLAAIWSRERPAGGVKVPLDRAGFGVNVGAGVEVLILRNLGAGVEYHYLYAKFAKKVGLTDNYSGPKLTFRLMVLF